MTGDETEARAVFTERYATTRTDLHRRIEQAVIGSDFGANGYTTLDQANRLAELLQLDATSRLLDLGAGRGWPGIHLAVQTGCQVVLTNMPLEGLRHALARGATEGSVAESGLWPQPQARRRSPQARSTRRSIPTSSAD